MILTIFGTHTYIQHSKNVQYPIISAVARLLMHVMRKPAILMGQSTSTIDTENQTVSQH